MTEDKSHWVGLHERLSSPALLEELKKRELMELANWRKNLEQEELEAKVYAHLGRVFSVALLELRERDRQAWEASIADLKQALIDAGHPLANYLDQLPELPLRELTEIRRPADAAVEARATTRPDLPLALSALLTGSRHSPSLVGQIDKELASADRADWLVSFIKFSGIRALKSSLRRFAEEPSSDGIPRLRVATTSYLGATDVKAIRTLLELPNTEVRVSFDTHRTRLHAKAYLFHRHTGFGTAYVGSANISRVALDEGLEWTARISQHELGHVWRQVVAGFQTHWSDENEFEPISMDDLPRLEEALATERGSQSGREPRSWHFLDLRPHAFQQEILDAIAEEREAGLSKHLVIAATGTGKTMVAAFDYRRFAQTQGHGSRPSMLFIAHREEILDQARNSFRHVLRDETFGDLLVGGRTPSHTRHLFCSVQSWNARDLSNLPEDHFDYVVLDEAHHAAAASYQRILEHIRPKVLLGLTATPERGDGQDIRDDFGSRFTHEMRLADAIEARHLVPFHYFGLGDHPDVDFSGLAWPRRGYRTQDLDRIVGTNERRARWVLRQLEDHVADLDRIRALGFCVSQRHAQFMADYFNVHGIMAEALTADSPEVLRQTARRRLVNREIQIIFTVDLFNEGIDIPEVDTVLFLRPTESLTVYLQQLGRGLRLHEGKANLTVLDFIAPQNRRFRFADRFRALSNRKEQRVDRQIETGFPWLPAGCLVRLDEKASGIVLANIRDTLAQRKPQILAQLAALRQEKGEEVSLAEMLDWLHLDDPDLLLKHGLPRSLMAIAGGKSSSGFGQYEGGFERALRQILVFDDRDILVALQSALQTEQQMPVSHKDLLLLALAMIWGGRRPEGGWREALSFIRSHAALRRDLLEVLEWRLGQLLQVNYRRFESLTGPLALHACYSREQIMLALGKGDFQTPFAHREGVLHVPERNLDALFVTVNKSDKDFSPTTQYEDYALNQELFHWQSQSTTSPESPTGQRYINHAGLGCQPLLFVRSGKKLPNGLTESFRYIGPIDYVRHDGSRPMSIVWRLQHPLRARELRIYRQEAI
ncbi:MAG: DUF3427 domain-containing protein [Wenzhouxiangella sp.]|nr:DUF3427 domain-containing protein [Wenzhouxiangella sp.]